MLNSEKLFKEHELAAIETEHPEGLSAQRIIDLFQRRGARVSEATFRKYVQLGPFSQDEGDKVFALAQEFKIELLSPRGLLLEAWELARDFNRPTIYDTSYMALANLMGCELWTGDERLINAIGGRAAWVKWVGSYTRR